MNKHFAPMNACSQETRTDSMCKTISKATTSGKNSSKVVPYDNIIVNDNNYTKKQDAWLDDIGVTNDHHRNAKKNKNKKCTNRCVVASAIGALFIITTLVITLTVVFLTKSKTTTSTSSAHIPLLRWNTAGITIIGTTNQSGANSSQLFSPWDLAIDWSNTLYVTDQGNNRVQKFLMGMSKGTTAAGYGNGTGSVTLYGLRGPLGVVVNDNSNIYVADAFNNRVVFWQYDALSGSLFAGNGTAGYSFSQLYAPYGLARDTNSGAIYVTDYQNNRVMCFFANNSLGILVAGGNGNGINNTQLSISHAVHFDSSSNSLLIANTGAHNIVRWILGASNWTLLAGSVNGSVGSTSTRLSSPTDVTFDPMGNMYAADRDNHRIQFYSAGESNGTTTAGMRAIIGTNSTLLNTPSSLALDSQLNLYVVDRNNHRIQKFLRY